MITTIPSQTREMSTVDALWVLIQSQTKAVRKALTERLLAERSQSKAKKTECEYIPNAETRADIEECESGKELETLNIANFKAYVKSL